MQTSNLTAQQIERYVDQAEDLRTQFSNILKQAEDQDLQILEDEAEELKVQFSDLILLYNKLEPVQPRELRNIVDIKHSLQEVIEGMSQINDDQSVIQNAITLQEQETYQKWVKEQGEQISSKIKTLKNEGNKKRKGQSKTQEKSNQIVEILHGVENKLDTIKQHIDGPLSIFLNYETLIELQDLISNIVDNPENSQLQSDLESKFISFESLNETLEEKEKEFNQREQDFENQLFNKGSANIQVMTQQQYAQNQKLHGNNQNSDSNENNNHQQQQCEFLKKQQEEEEEEEERNREERERQQEQDNQRRQQQKVKQQQEKEQREREKQQKEKEKLKEQQKKEQQELQMKQQQQQQLQQQQQQQLYQQQQQQQQLQQQQVQQQQEKAKQQLIQQNNNNNQQKQEINGNEQKKQQEQIINGQQQQNIGVQKKKQMTSLQIQQQQQYCQSLQRDQTLGYYIRMMKLSNETQARSADYFPSSLMKEKISIKSHFPKHRMLNEKVFKQLDLETLFFIFYLQKNTYEQYLAAKELKQREWRFHTKFSTWFKRMDSPKQLNKELEIGNYIFFDFEKAWQQRKKTEFQFKYQYFEKEDL